MYTLFGDLTMDLSTKALLLVARWKLPRKQPGKSAERERTKGSRNVWNITRCHKGKIYKDRVKKWLAMLPISRDCRKEKGAC